jgi:hypothetical protein
MEFTSDFFQTVIVYTGVLLGAYILGMITMYYIIMSTDDVRE